MPADKDFESLMRSTHEEGTGKLRLRDAEWQGREKGRHQLHEKGAEAERTPRDETGKGHRAA